MLYNVRTNKFRKYEQKADEEQTINLDLLYRKRKHCAKCHQLFKQLAYSVEMIV